MTSNRIFRFMLFIAVAVGIAAVVTKTREDRPRLISVRPAAKRTPMPPFRWPVVSGDKWNLQDQRGRIVVVNFWATWCGPCRSEMPALVRVEQRYRSHGVSFAGVSLDRDPHKVVPSFASRYSMQFPVLIPAPDSALANAIATIPTTFLLDREGRVARVWAGALHESELAKNVEELLAEGRR